MKISPLAGKPAETGMLVNVPKLITAYYTERPDPSILKQRVSFGTSGHRGSAFDKAFNEWHILAISQALCLYRKQQKVNGPLFIGMDTHALSVPALASALEVLAANGVEVMLSEGDEYTPTPANSLAILMYNRGRKSGLADGIVITPSHNPPHDGGFKYNPPNGGPAEDTVTGWIEAKANKFLEGGLKGVTRTSLKSALRAPTTHFYDYLNAYINELTHVVDLDAISAAKISLGVDPLGGEESAGATFVRRDGSVWTTDKDGMIPALLAAEITARMGRDPGEIYSELTREFGEPAYQRLEAPATPEQKAVLEKLSPEQIQVKDLAGEKIEAILTKAPGNAAPIGGLKVVTESGWCAARPSTAGSILGINAFDQPNVQESKDNTNRLLAIVRERGSLPEENPSLVKDPLKLYFDGAATTVPETIKRFLDQARSDDYLAVTAFITENLAHDEALTDIRALLQERLHLTTTLGYGPRFLHSTGQFHKGGPNIGLYLQLTADDVEDVPIPGAPYTFGIFKRAQALGDLEALQKHERRVGRVHLGSNMDRGLTVLMGELKNALQSKQVTS